MRFRFKTRVLAAACCLGSGVVIPNPAAAEKPDGVPSENWLPVNRGDYGVDIMVRMYAPDLKRYKTWSPPKAEEDEVIGTHRLVRHELLARNAATRKGEA